MPGFDRTGPMGAGPMTGGTRGRCNPDSAGHDSRFFKGAYRGLGLKRGFRGGFDSPINQDFRFAPTGMGRLRRAGSGYGWFSPTIDPDLPVNAAGEVDMLKAQAGYMKNSLDAINERIAVLEKKSAEAS